MSVIFLVFSIQEDEVKLKFILCSVDSESKFFPVHIQKAYTRSNLNSIEMSGHLLTMVALAAGKNPSTHSVGVWLGPIAGLDSFVEANNLMPLPGYEH